MSNFIVLDGIELEESEKSYLSIPQKFRERDGEWWSEMELQLESNTVKERWESRLIQEMEENGIEDKETPKSNKSRCQ